MADDSDLQRRFERMAEKSRDFGDGGRLVLETAYHTLAAGRVLERWPDVGLEDLWAHAIQEGRSLFNKPAARWGKTGPHETKDMNGQTTVGPWQLTVGNIIHEYGVPYGVHADWPEARVFEFIESHPGIQVGMICDYIQKSYSQFGTRSPFAIQRYFWLEAYVRKEIGQGQWDKSVLPTSPDGDWKKLTAVAKADTGFYAKQVLLGYDENPHGLIYWLWTTGDLEGIRATFAAWRNQNAGTWNATKLKVEVGTTNAGLAISEGDLKYIPEAARAAVAKELASATTSPATSQATSQ